MSRIKIDTTSVAIFALVAVGLLAFIGGVAFEVLKLVAVVKYVFS